MTNLIKLNDVRIKQLLAIVVGIQVAILGLFGLRVIDYSIPLVTQIIGFIYLSFIPGILTLRALRIHGLSTGETLCYAVGLSIALTMFTGFAISIVGYGLGVSGYVRYIAENEFRVYPFWREK